MIDFKKNKIFSFSTDDITKNWIIILSMFYFCGFIFLQFPDIFNFGIIDYPIHHYIIYGIFSVFTLYLYHSIINLEVLRNKRSNGSVFSLSLDDMIVFILASFMLYIAIRDNYYIFYNILIAINVFVVLILKIIIKVYKDKQNTDAVNYTKKILQIILFIGFFISVNASLLNFIKVNYIHKDANIYASIKSYSNSKIICINSDSIYFYTDKGSPIIINKTFVNYIEYYSP